ncbi:MAG: hypothetical protein RQ982_04245 [Gammaproteobacteria bacterium]|nr:hypothetical protein [Gammaproteobacteria bacterium]
MQVKLSRYSTFYQVLSCTAQVAGSEQKIRSKGVPLLKSCSLRCLVHHFTVTETGDLEG